MKRTVLLMVMLTLAAGCGGIKVSKSMLKMMVSGSNKASTEVTYADSCDKRVGVPYVEGGHPN